MKNLSRHLIAKWELRIHLTFPAPSSNAGIDKDAQFSKVTVSFVKEVLRNFRCPILSLYIIFLVITHSRVTDTHLGVPFCTAVREHTQFITLSFSLLIVRLLTQGYLYLTPVPIWLTDANLSPFNYTVNFHCFMKLINPVIFSPIDNLKRIFGTEPIIFDR